ncbi:glycosyltransferase [Enhydrobacter aerosaccus]|uniref:glycosyltransferase n=1 Tax=Enhydrobacter aerosaccus TaxID=225324 RepID=UPI001E54487C|nr:glycosyltransferase [Enhydrobacter aerosaccus]
MRYGGPIRSVHALCRGLAARGHDVHVFTTSVDGDGDSDVPLGQVVDLEGVKVTYFQSRWLRRLYWSPPLYRALTASLPKFDLVHLHAIYLWPMWAGAHIARASHVPYVSSPRGMLAPQLIRRKNRLIKEAWLALIERRNLEKAAAIHATSTGEADDLRALGWSLPPVRIIPHGVDDPEPLADATISPDVAAAISGGGYVLALGRINWEKGLDRLIAALPYVPLARLLIAGGDREGHAAMLAELARQADVGDRVTILSRHVDGADKEALFAHAAAFAMTSLSENFGLAAFEAMRRGLPVVVTREVGMSEIVREAKAGLVVEGNPQAISSGLDAILCDPAKRQAMGEAGRNHVVAHYGWPAVAEQMEDLYRSILQTNTSKSMVR